jgi:hypothetical protein
MTGGERRLAERLEQKLDADYLIWSWNWLCFRQLPFGENVSPPVLP